MPKFDPEAATAAYMASLPPEAHQKAIDYTQGGHWLLLWGWLIGVVAAVLIAKSGVLPRLTSRLQSQRPRRKLAAFLAVVVFTLIDFAIELPWTAYARWWREKSYDFTHQSLGGWCGELLIGLAISTVITGLLFIAIYSLMRRAPKSWWFWSSLVAIAGIILMVVLAPAFIEPLFNKYTPAPPGAVRDTIVQMAKATGVPSDKIYVYNGSKQSERYTANVSGLFGSARVAMSDTMFKQNADMAEVKGVVGHEMGHYVRKHILWQSLAFSILAIAGFWLTDRLYPVVRGWLGEDRRLGTIADPAGFPVIVIILGTLGLLATPIFNTISRTAEADADHFSAVHIHEPDGLAKALVKTIAYRASSPSKLEEVLFYDHPSVENRVHALMRWKAENPDKVGTPPD